ncbi:MAG: hypothetical protein AAGF11_37580 [Myxococcota bacterium]
MPPRLKAVSVRHYRCFAQEFRLELRPLTLIYGRDNAGKSAAVRLIGLLADSVRDSARAPLDFGGEAGGGASFDDILWKGIPEDERPIIWLTLEWEEAGEQARHQLNLKKGLIGDIRDLSAREAVQKGDRALQDMDLDPLFADIAPEVRELLRGGFVGLAGAFSDDGAVDEESFRRDVPTRERAKLLDSLLDRL